MGDHGNDQLQAVGFFNPALGQSPLGTFFGGGVGGGVSSPGPFDLETAESDDENVRSPYKVVNRYMYFGRTLLTDPDGESTVLDLPSDSVWTLYAAVAHTDSGEPSLSVEKTTQAPSSSMNDLDKTYVALWYNRRKGSNEYELVDMRRAPVTAAYLP